MADILTKLSNKYGCDKSDRKHKYTSEYHSRFNNLMNEKFNMIEFGFGTGKSVRMWLEYFKKANIASVDIRDHPKEKVFQNKRFEYVKADQTNFTKMARLIVKYKRFYLIIDDASHVAEDQQFTFGYMFPWVENGGWYVIEDLKCKRSHSTKFGVEAPKTIPVIQKYMKTGIFDSPVLNKEQKMYIKEHIEDIKLYEKIAFIKKR